MFPVIDKCELAPGVTWLRLAAPLVARHCHPGQFVITRVCDSGERIPLTIADFDRDLGTIDLIVKAVGATTRKLCALSTGQCLADVVGPLGRPTELLPVDHAVLIGGGVGTAVIYPLARALHARGSFVTVITGGQSRRLVILEHELKCVADVVMICTDDGSYGFHGTVVDRLVELLNASPVPIGAVYAAGPVPMMRAAAEATRSRAIPTIVSLNPIMVDGTGMCGGCRVTVGGKVHFACVDGPEFDGHAVDFAELTDRLSAYRAQEQTALRRQLARSAPRSAAAK